MTKAEIWHARGRRKWREEPIKEQVAIYYPDLKKVDFFKYYYYYRDVSDDMLKGSGEQLVCKVPSGRFGILYKEIWLEKPRDKFFVSIYYPFRRDGLKVFEFDTRIDDCSRRLLEDSGFVKWCEFEAWWEI